MYNLYFRRSQRKLFHNHDLRSFLTFFLMLLYLAELGDYLLSDTRVWYIKLIPVSALISIIVCQIFYMKVEEFGKCYYLIVAIVYWFCCGCCRGFTFFTNISLGLDFKYVRYTTSLLTTLTCIYLGVHDFITLLKEVS